MSFNKNQKTKFSRAMRQCSSLACVLLLANCTTPEQKAEEYRQQLVNQCEQLGFTNDDPNFKDCMLSLHQQDQARRSAMAAVILGNMRPYQPAPMQMPPLTAPAFPTPPVQTFSKPITTSCMKNGQFINCSSY